MLDDENLRSKYARLGLEYKKLRERYRSVKERLKSTVDRATQLETKLSDQTIHARNLEHEKESLMFRNKYLIEQAAFLEKQLKHGLPTPNDCSFGIYSQDDVLKNMLLEVSNLHEEVTSDCRITKFDFINLYTSFVQLVAQSSRFLARIAQLESSRHSSLKYQGVSVSVQTSTLPILSPSTQSSSFVDAASTLNALYLQNVCFICPCSVGFLIFWDKKYI